VCAASVLIAYVNRTAHWLRVAFVTAFVTAVSGFFVHTKYIERHRLSGSYSRRRTPPTPRPSRKQPFKPLRHADNSISRAHKKKVRAQVDESLLRKYSPTSMDGIKIKTFFSFYAKKLFLL